MTVTAGAPAHEHDETCGYSHPTVPAVGRPSWVHPAIVGAIGLAACVLLNLRDPNQSGSWGFCPFKVMTGGLDCPGCGILRGTRSLTRGDVAGALDHNLLIFPILGLLLYAYLRWAGASVGIELPAWRPKPWVVWVAGIVMVGFWVVRNLPQFPYLASGVS